MGSQKKKGVILSYLNLAIQMLTSLLITPALIASLGDESYSIYRVMHSFAGPLAMFNLGVSTIVTRAIVKYRVSDEHNEEEKQNTIALCLAVSFAISVFVLILSGILYAQIPNLYGKNYSPAHIEEGKKLFVLLSLSTVLNLLTEAFRGCALGNEKYIFNTAIPLGRSIFRACSILLCIYLKQGAVTITVVDFLVSLGVFIVYAGYALLFLKEKPRFTVIKKAELISIGTFALASFLQAAVNQVNNNVDTMLLGALVENKAIITMYSSALVIYSVYNSLISVVAGILLPKASQLIENKASGKELTNFVIRPGRFQAMISVAIIVVFGLLGKDFIELWIGAAYSDAYYIVLMLIIPVTIPLVENAAISILDASLKRIYRSVVLVVMAILNVIVSIVLIRLVGFWGAAIGTVLSLCVGHILLMNIYYKKTFNMEIVRMFKEIFEGTLWVGIVSGIICLPLLLLKNTLILFLIKGTVFVVVYSILLWKFGMRTEEKKMIFGRIKKNL